MPVPNVLGALDEKIRRLNQRKADLTAEYKAQCAAIDSEIGSLQNARQTVIDTIKDILCTRCEGTGEERCTDAAGSRETRPCRDCGGTGIKKN